ncbi:hypothetical protein [Sandarakinorhabdus sp. AAP62]|uniref:hypothetical protein n=1 Tax=Sandarakinorhabdus sp. AAP62 TaxID=1248916 RepID=UPI000303713A|nr:hypothetical protein [Sandarakinorhabdus sp. AAP62]
MKLTFTKGAGKYDRLDIVAGDGPRAAIDCPKQGIIPHDMVHWAVEAEVAAAGFLRLIARGGDSGQRAALGISSAESVERLVEMFQGEGWSQTVLPDDAFIALYAVTCEDRGDTPLPITGALLTAIRSRMAEVSAQWAAVSVGGKMVLELPAHPQ